MTRRTLEIAMAGPRGRKRGACHSSTNRVTSRSVRPSPSPKNNTPGVGRPGKNMKRVKKGRPSPEASTVTLPVNGLLSAAPGDDLTAAANKRRSKRLAAIPSSPLTATESAVTLTSCTHLQGKSLEVKEPQKASTAVTALTRKNASSAAVADVASTLSPVKNSSKISAPSEIHHQANPRKRRISSRTDMTGDGESSVEAESDSEEAVFARCPVPGCDSTGHLSGKYDQHLTPVTCPIYHNLTPSDCIDRFQRRVARRTEAAAKSSPAKSGPELRKSPNKKANEIEEKIHSLQEQRKKDMSTILSTVGPRGKQAIQFNGTGTSAREPELLDLTPIFDYEMFREAQSRAAAIVQKHMDEAAGLTNCSKNTHKSSLANGPTKNNCHAKSKNNQGNQLKSIVLGKWEMDIWYSSPYPNPYEYLSLPKLYICEFCLKYFNSPLIMKRHVIKCIYRHPPGDEIYRKGNISFFEVDGDKNITYCQNLCLLAKLFLHHKTLYYDVEPFRFYIMTEADNEGFHIIGYFSKEKNSFLNYNVSCILALPPYQKQGYGRMLIEFSYLLTKREGKTGSPEKPLSDLGLISYRSYWKNVILEYLCNFKGNDISIRDLSQETAINAYDIVSTLQALGMLKYWKGKHLVLIKKEVLDEFRAKQAKMKKGNKKRIDANYLHWTPPSANSTGNSS